MKYCTDKGIIFKMQPSDALKELSGLQMKFTQPSKRGLFMYHDGAMNQILLVGVGAFCGFK